MLQVLGMPRKLMYRTANLRGEININELYKHTFMDKKIQCSLNVFNLEPRRIYKGDIIIFTVSKCKNWDC